MQAYLYKRHRQQNNEILIRHSPGNQLEQYFGCKIKTSVTRATAQLEEMDFIEQLKSGTEISIKRNYSRKEYYEKAKAYLINSVQKVITIMRSEATFESFGAGESALSQVSELNPPRIEERAIYKGEEVVDLVPFKMYAWINLLDRKRAGEHVNEKDLKKHKNDVFRLLQIVTIGIKVESEGLVTESIHKYIEEISAVDESEIRFLQMGMPFDRDRGVELLKEIYL